MNTLIPNLISLMITDTEKLETHQHWWQYETDTKN